MITNSDKRDRYLSDAELTRRLQAAEEEHDLLQYRVDGWCLWPTMRCAIAWKLKRLPKDLQKPPVRHSRLMWAAQDLWRIPRVQAAKTLVVTNDSARQESVAGRFRDECFDDIMDLLPDYFRLEHSTCQVFRDREKRAAIRANLSFTLFDLIANQIVKKKSSREQRSLAAHLGAVLRIAFGEEIEIDNVWIDLQTRYFRAYRKIYNWFLRRLKPRRLLIMPGYGDYSLQAAVKERGATVVEFQHGVLDRYHFGYSWSSYARPYKLHMPIPDRILLYGEYWRSELAADGFWDSELRVVGSPRVDRYRTIASRTDDVRTVVVTSQGVDTERLLEFLGAVLQQVTETRDDVRMIVKLHPNELDRSRYDRALGRFSQASILLSTEGPSTFELLGGASCHASIYSTCHYEAIALGVPTIVIGLTGHEHVATLCKTGHAVLASTPQDMANFVVGTRPLLHASREARTHYFREDTMRAIKRELDHLPLDGDDVDRRLDPAS